MREKLKPRRITFFTPALNNRMDRFHSLRHNLVGYRPFPTLRFQLRLLPVRLDLQSLPFLSPLPKLTTNTSSHPPVTDLSSKDGLV